MKNTCYHHSVIAVPEQSFFSDVVFRYQKDKNTQTMGEMKKRKEQWQNRKYTSESNEVIILIK